MFQRLYNFFRNIQTPKWLRDFLFKLEEIIFDIAYDIGSNYFATIKEKIIEVSADPISGEEKFKKVFSYIKKELPLSHLKDSAINLIIEMLVNYLKNKSII